MLSVLPFHIPKIPLRWYLLKKYSRQGHDPVTSLKHYQSLSFTDYEMRDIKKRLMEWGILKGE